MEQIFLALAFKTNNVTERYIYLSLSVIIGTTAIRQLNQNI